jgi:hypothetical protein
MEMRRIYQTDVCQCRHDQKRYRQLFQTGNDRKNINLAGSIKQEVKYIIKLYYAYSFKHIASSI